MLEDGPRSDPVHVCFVPFDSDFIWFEQDVLRSILLKLSPATICYTCNTYSSVIHTIPYTIPAMHLPLYATHAIPTVV